jgi:ribonuclease HII
MPSRPAIGSARKQPSSDELRYVGVDEAGRGPVLGPMVIAICALTARDRRWCATHNITDSKLVPAARRDRLAQALRERCWSAMAVIHPPEIDAAVRNRAVTLNGLETKYMAQLIKQFHEAFSDSPAEIMVDAPVRRTLPFRNLLQYMSGWPDINTLKAENEADLWHRHVGAASIIAKAERERLMHELQKTIGHDVGCGYAHDELSRAYVKTALPDDPLVRWSWMTASDIKNEDAATMTML